MARRKNALLEETILKVLQRRPMALSEVHAHLPEVFTASRDTLGRVLQRMRLGGRVHIINRQWAHVSLASCMLCDGKGWANNQRCPTCGGLGWVRRTV